MQEHGVELQKTIIGELWLDGKDKYIKLVREEWFTDFDCRMIFNLLKKLGIRNDIFALKTRLEMDSIPNAEHFIKFLIKCEICAVSVACLENHLELLRQDVISKRIENIVKKNEGKLSLKDIEEVHKISSPFGIKQFDVKDLKDLVLDFPSEYEKRMELYKNGVPYSTGFKKLDARTGGILTRNLTIVGGRTSLGKTALMTNIAVALAKNNIKTLYLSCEMEAYELFDRILASQTDVESFSIKFAKLSDNQMKKIIDVSAKDDFYLKPLKIVYTPGLDYDSIVNLVENFKPKMLIIDHLQIMRFKGPNRAQAMEDTAYMLKDLAGENDIGIVLGSQINRASVIQGQNKLEPTGFKGSGGIEDSATVAIQIKLAEEENKENVEWLMDIEVQKARFGPVGTERMVFNRRFARFEERDFVIEREANGGH